MNDRDEKRLRRNMRKHERCNPVHCPVALTAVKLRELKEALCVWTMMRPCDLRAIAKLRAADQKAQPKHLHCPECNAALAGDQGDWCPNCDRHWPIGA